MFARLLLAVGLGWLSVMSISMVQAEPADLAGGAEGSAIRLTWKTDPSAASYVVLRSTKLGWRASTALIEPVVKPTDSALPLPDVIAVTNTYGLRVGDEITVYPKDNRLITEVIDSQHLRLSMPLLSSYSVGTKVLLFGCWLRDYSGYSQLGQTVATTFLDTTTSSETDYFYVIGYSDGTSIYRYGEPINIKVTAAGALYDAAVGCNGGVAWVSLQKDGDVPVLIDGDVTTGFRAMISDPGLMRKNPILYTNNALGFLRITLNGPTAIKRFEYTEDAWYPSVSKIRIGLDNGRMLSFEPNSDPTVVRAFDRNYRNFRIPMNETSRTVSVYVDGLMTNSTKYTIFRKISAYSDQPVAQPVVSAAAVTNVPVIIDFSRTNGTAPAIFGTDEIWNNTAGEEIGWMKRAWPVTTKLFNVYRVQMGDHWPRYYSVQHVPLGSLARDVGPADSVFYLTNASFLSRGSYGDYVSIGDEVARFRAAQTSGFTTYERGNRSTIASNHGAGTPVFLLKDQNQLGLAQEVLPEFKMIRYDDAYLTGLKPIDSSVPVNDPSRTAVVSFTLNRGSYAPGDVIRIGAEMFRILGVTNMSKGYIDVAAQRGLDGTSEVSYQQGYPPRTVFKVLDYEPFYVGFKNDPSVWTNYYWDSLKYDLDLMIKDAKSVPWFITWGPNYATESRGFVAAVETITNSAGCLNNVVVDGYNLTNSDTGWWFLASSPGAELDESRMRLCCYQLQDSRIKFLTGNAAGKGFYIRANTDCRVAVVQTIQDTYPNCTNVHYVDLTAEGVQPGDAFKIFRPTYACVTKKYRQYMADYFYNVVKFVRQSYASELGGRPFYVEFYNEPNLAMYGNWEKGHYLASFNALATTIRNGGPHFSTGFSRDEVWIGAGSVAGGINGLNKMVGERGDYDMALSLIENSPVIDFVSHHRYHMGTRSEKRQNSYEYWMLRDYASSLGKDVRIIDSEDSVATGGGTGHEHAWHYAQFTVPYWHMNFITSYSGEYGPLGRVDLILHFRHFQNYSEDSLGLASPDASGNPLLDGVYWSIQMYQQHTSRNWSKPDSLATVICPGDQYSWIQAMGTTHGETGARKIHLVNKKTQPIVVNLQLFGVPTNSVLYMDSAIGYGPSQTIGDGYFPMNYQGEGDCGPILRQRIASSKTVVLPPCSANVVSLGDRLVSRSRLEIDPGPTNVQVLK